MKTIQEMAELKYRRAMKDITSHEKEIQERGLRRKGMNPRIFELEPSQPNEWLILNLRPRVAKPKESIREKGTRTLTEVAKAAAAREDV